MNSIPSNRPNQLVNALIDCLPKILQLYEAILSRLMLQIDCNAIKIQKTEWSKGQSACNGHQYDRMGSKSLRLLNCSYQDANSQTRNNGKSNLADSANKFEEIDEKSMRLAHIISDLLNEIEAGGKTNIMGTTEVIHFFLDSKRIEIIKYF